MDRERERERGENPNSPPPPPLPLPLSLPLTLSTYLMPRRARIRRGHASTEVTSRPSTNNGASVTRQHPAPKPLIPTLTPTLTLTPTPTLTLTLTLTKASRARAPFLASAARRFTLKMTTDNGALLDPRLSLTFSSSRFEAVERSSRGGVVSGTWWGSRPEPGSGPGSRSGSRPGPGAGQGQGQGQP